MHISRVIFAISMICCRSIAQDVGPAIQAVAAVLYDSKAPEKKVKELQSTMTDRQLAEKLTASLWGTKNISTEAATIRMLLAVKPFPFEYLHDLAIATDNSVERAYLLSLLDMGAATADQVEQTLALAKTLLPDLGKGFRRYGEARAYSADDLRVCDVAYNVLVTRLSITPPMQPVNVDNFSVKQRDKLIQMLIEKTRLTLPDSPSGNVGMTPAPQPPPPANIQFKPFEPSSQSASKRVNEPKAHLPWVIVMVLVFVLIGIFGVLHLLLKNRK